MQIKQIIQLHLRGEKIKAIVRSSGVTRNTVKFYLRRFKELSLSSEELLAMEVPVLEEKIFESSGPADKRKSDFEKRRDYFLKELENKKVTKQLLWEEYRRDNSDGYGLSQFCHYLHQYGRVREAVMVQNYPPGERMTIDFSGDKLRYVIKDSGEIILCEVFVAVLDHSNFIFARALHSQKLEEVIGSCVAALNYFGGSPKIIVPDNFKAAVTKADRYEPRINDVFLDMAIYYGAAVVPARAGKPKDKAKVERGVNIVYQRVFAPLRNKVFGSLHELNLAILEEIEKLNDRLMKLEGCTRRQLFDLNEKPVLLPLPLEPYELRRFSELTVQFTSHVYITHIKKYFSVPYILIGQKVKVILTEKNVSIYHNGERVAYHLCDGPKKYVSLEDHMPSHHKHILAQKNIEDIRLRAASLGESVLAAINIVLSRNKLPEQNYKTCAGIFAVARKTTPEVLREACDLAILYGVVSYANIQRLALGQFANRKPKPTVATHADHENIRGKNLFE